MTTQVNGPIPFSGSEEEKKANFNTHDWIQADVGEYRCGACDSKPWYAAAKYPCGVEPPRQNFEVENARDLLPKGLFG